MSRLSNTIKNAKIGLLFHVLFIFAQFISRKIFLNGLGDSFIGSVSTLQSFLGFLNLAELGIGTAIGYTLYKPIHEKNYNEINSIVRFFGHIYKKIGLFILTVSILLSCFFPIIFKEVEINLWLIYLTFFGLLTSSLLGYFFNYHIFLLQADQKDYVIAKNFQSLTILKIIIQAILVYNFENIFLWILLEFIAAITSTYVIRNKVRQEYPWLILSEKINSKDKNFSSYKLLIKKIKQISIHKIGEFLASGLDNILIFFFLSAQFVAFFANYQMVLVNLGTLVEKIFAGSKASIGNLVAENNPTKIKQVFWEFMAIRFFIAGFGSSCIYNLINTFITIWLGEKYVLSNNTTIIFAAIFFLRQIVQPTEVFKQAYGLFDDVWAPIVKSLLNLILSIVLVKSNGISGLLIGTFISVLTIEGVWRPYYVYKRGFKKNVSEYIKGYLKLIVAFLISTTILNYIYPLIVIKTETFLGLLIKTLWISSSTFFIYGFTLYITNNYCRDVISRLSSKFSN